jgi:hypothetical protein|nr:MAG TPA: hypothetical protein [Caudoviricetes sp.]
MPILTPNNDEIRDMLTTLSEDNANLKAQLESVTNTLSNVTEKLNSFDLNNVNDQIDKLRTDTFNAISSISVPAQQDSQINDDPEIEVKSINELLGL